MRFALLLALLPAVALADPPLGYGPCAPGTTCRVARVRATAASGSDGLQLNGGACIDWLGVGKLCQPDGGSSGGGGGWQTALDCNFSTQPAQLLPTVEAATFVACGVTWTRRGVAYDTLAAIDGGLEFFPDAGTCSPCFVSTYASTLSDQVTLPLTVIPNFLPTTPVRVTVWVSGESGSPFPAGGSAQGTHLAITNEPNAHATGPPYATFAYAVARASRTASHGWESDLAFSGSNFDRAIVSDTTLSSGPSNVMRLVLPNGYGGGALMSTEYATYSSGFPTLSTNWAPLAQIGDFSLDTIYQAGSSNNWLLVLGAENGFGTVAVVIGRVLVEYQAL